MTPNNKPYVEYDATKHGGFRTSRFPGNCRWCGLAYSEGDKVNWNPRVKHTCCHAGCYGEYGSPVPQQQFSPTYTPKPEPTFVPPPKPKIEPIATTDRTGLPQAIVDAIVPYLNGRLEGLVTREQVESVIDKILGDRVFRTVTTITVERETDILELDEVMDLGVQHKKFPRLMQYLKAKHEGYHLNILLTGPAGTGKTTAARNVAKALGLNFGFMGAISARHEYLGYMNLKGELVRTHFREIWEHGGVFLFDEMDGSNANESLPLNAGLANHIMAFPDGLIPQHPKCIIICAMNTWGLGGNDKFVGRNKLDATTLNRYVKLYWDNDDDMEIALSNNPAWAKRVQTVRANVKRTGTTDVMITSRQSLYGAALLEVGVPQHEVEELLLRESMSETQWNNVK